MGRWQERLWRYAFRVTGSEAVAWDIVQETWYSVIKGLHKLKDVSIFPCWVFRIANNKCADWVREQQRQSRLNNHLEEDLKRKANQKAEEKADILQRAIAGLTPERRSLIMLRYSGDFNIGQIARILSIPEGTVKSRLHRTVNELRQLVERYQNE